MSDAPAASGSVAVVGVLPEEEVCSGTQILPFEEVEKRVILRALRLCGWNVAQAAVRLHIGAATVYRRIHHFEIRLPVRARGRSAAVDPLGQPLPPLAATA